jgi:hypothetical protein
MEPNCQPHIFLLFFSSSNSFPIPFFPGVDLSPIFSPFPTPVSTPSFPPRMAPLPCVYPRQPLLRVHLDNTYGAPAPPRDIASARVQLPPAPPCSPPRAKQQALRAHGVRS